LEVDPLHFYPFNIADYRKDTGHLSLAEHGIYRQLLDSYYLDEKPIETKSVIRRLSIRTESDKEALENVLADFFVKSDCGNYYRHKRADDEIEKYRARADSARENGKKGGRPKKPTETDPVILGSEKKPNGKLTKEPNNLVTNELNNLGTKELNNQSSKDLPDAKPKSVERFDIFWKLHPKKKSKGAAEKAWKRMTAEEQQAAIDKLPEAMDSADWKKDGGKFIPYPATWLNSKGWEDEFEGAMDRYQDFINGDAGNVYEGEVENAGF
jgi:uncharacterized protein YdaU (DUF1376 family)